MPTEEERELVIETLRKMMPADPDKNLSLQQLQFVLQQGGMSNDAILDPIQELQEQEVIVFTGRDILLKGPNWDKFCCLSALQDMQEKIRTLLDEKGINPFFAPYIQDAFGASQMGKSEEEWRDAIVSRAPQGTSTEWLDEQIAKAREAGTDFWPKTWM